MSSFRRLVRPARSHNVPGRPALRVGSELERNNSGFLEFDNMDTREDNTCVEEHTESQSQHEQNDWEPRDLIDKEAFVSGPFELEAPSPLVELDAVRHPDKHHTLDLPSHRTALHMEQEAAATNQQSRRSSASTAVEKQESVESQVHQLCTGFDPGTHCEEERDINAPLGPPFVYEGGCPYQFGQKKFRLIEM